MARICKVGPYHGDLDKFARDAAKQGMTVNVSVRVSLQYKDRVFTFDSIEECWSFYLGFINGWVQCDRAEMAARAER